MHINNDSFSILYPGRIVNYYPDSQTADITISAERIFSDTVEKLQQVDRQMLIGIPVHTAYGGGWSITFPIKTGDTCLIAFSQIGYDHWLYEDKDTGGTVSKQPVPHLRRQFSEDDGFAIVGFNTIPRKIQSYSSSNSQWRNDDTSQIISLNEDGSIDITSPNNVTITGSNISIVADNVTITASTQITLDSPETLVTGNLTVGGISMNTHTHSQGNDSNGDAEVDTSGPL